MSKVSVHQRKARDFIQREDWGNALVELERLLEGDSNNPTLHNQVGDVYLRKDEVGRACEHFERAIDLYAEVGLHNNAVALCKKVMRLRPGRFEMRYRLARLRLDQGFRMLGVGIDCGLLLRSLKAALATVGRDRQLRANLSTQEKGTTDAPR